MLLHWRIQLVTMQAAAVQFRRRQSWTLLATQKTEDGKTVLDSWSTAKRLLKPDPRYNKMPRKERETLWRRYAEEMFRKQKSSPDQKEDRHTDAKNRSSNDSGRYQSGSRRTHDRT
ncbi:hypothetical protein D5086_016127 [Populus alba]|uniref:Uncharacterized protein n=1 Tax=Populus alba TaxID=43335 RepID=A0ACC4BT68_POPAL